MSHRLTSQQSMPLSLPCDCLRLILKLVIEDIQDDLRVQMTKKWDKRTSVFKEYLNLQLVSRSFSNIIAGLRVNNKSLRESFIDLQRETFLNYIKSIRPASVNGTKVDPYCPVNVGRSCSAVWKNPSLLQILTDLFYGKNYHELFLRSKLFLICHGFEKLAESLLDISQEVIKVEGVSGGSPVLHAGASFGAITLQGRRRSLVDIQLGGFGMIIPRNSNDEAKDGLWTLLSIKKFTAKRVLKEEGKQIVPKTGEGSNGSREVNEPYGSYWLLCKWSVTEECVIEKYRIIDLKKKIFYKGDPWAERHRWQEYGAWFSIPGVSICYK